MQIEDFLAEPLALSIRLRIGPGVDDVVSIDQQKFDSRKSEIVSYCLEIPNINEGLSWQLLMPYAGQNGLMAKLLVAMGELAGVWKMHPPVHLPDVWRKSRAYPMILAGSVQGLPEPLKPSSGALEPTGQCKCCHRPMGPPDSRFHDLFEYMNGICWECFEEECEPPDDCLLGFQKKAEGGVPPPPGPTEAVPDGLEEYLAQFRD